MTTLKLHATDAPLDPWRSVDAMPPCVRDAIEAGLPAGRAPQ